MILSKCFNLFKTSSSSVFAATIFAQMAIKSVSISSFTIYTSFAISSSISTLGATIFTTLHNTEVYLLTIISNRDDSLLSGNIVFSFGLMVSRGGLPGIMGRTILFWDYGWDKIQEWVNTSLPEAYVCLQSFMIFISAITGCCW